MLIATNQIQFLYQHIIADKVKPFQHQCEENSDLHLFFYNFPQIFHHLYMISHIASSPRNNISDT